jgi:hypothetical protein
MPRRDEFNPVAFTVPFDKDNDPSCGFTKENTQEAIEELCNKAAITASPGFTWESSGNTTSNSWLLNGVVSSNKTGRNFPLYNGVLNQISIANENINTFDIELYEHDGTTFTLLTTVSIIAARSGVFDSSDFGTINLTQGKELAIKQVNGSSKNPVIQIIARGTTTP